MEHYQEALFLLELEVKFLDLQVSKLCALFLFFRRLHVREELTISLLPARQYKALSFLVVKEDLSQTVVASIVVCS